MGSLLTHSDDQVNHAKNHAKNRPGTAPALRPDCPAPKNVGNFFGPPLCLRHIKTTFKEERIMRTIAIVIGLSR